MYKYTSMQGVGEVHRVYGVHELCGWMRCMGFMVFVGVCVYVYIYIYIYISRKREMYEDSTVHGQCAWAAWTAYVDGGARCMCGGGCMV